MIVLRMLRALDICDKYQTRRTRARAIALGECVVAPIINCVSVLCIIMLLCTNTQHHITVNSNILPRDGRVLCVLETSDVVFRQHRANTQPNVGQNDTQDFTQPT